MTWTEEELVTETWNFKAEQAMEIDETEDSELFDSCSEKMFQIITRSTNEESLIETLETIGISGYILCDVRGDTRPGFGMVSPEQSSTLFMVVVSKELFNKLLSTLGQFMKKGNHLVVLASDIEVMIPTEFS